MIPTRRILFASAIAPLGLALPLFVVVYFMSSSFFAQAQPGSESASASPLLIAVLGVIQVYLPLVALYVVVGLAFRRLELLTRNSFLVTGALASVAIGLWLGCDWEVKCATGEALQGLLIQTCVCLVLFTTVSLLWWYLASKKLAPATVAAATTSEA